MKRLATLFLVFAATSASAYVGPSTVGNGDDGNDLEGATPITSGPVLEARQKAVELLRGLNTQGVGSLGMLIPEVSSSPLYAAKRDSGAQTSEDQGSFHADMRGLVFARTFAQPHAAT